MTHDTPHQVTIEGPTTDHTTGPYGDTGCDRTLHVVVDGEDVYVPWDAVRRHAYDFRGNVPDEFDVDRIILYDDHIHAESDVNNGTVELMPDYNFATAEFQGYDSWELELFDADSVQEGSTVYEREE